MGRDELIELCERAIVPEEFWGNRDSELSHLQVGRLWALLKAGCEYRVITESNKRQDDFSCVSNEDTIWVSVSSRGFHWFENEDGDDYLTIERYYLPTEKRLEERQGLDWY